MRKSIRVSRLLLSSMLLAALAGAQIVAQGGQAQQPAPQRKRTQSGAGENCAKGAGNALTATALVTGLGCVVDLFLTGGTLCVAYISTAVANAPTAAVTGCAIGAMGTSAAGASAGISAAPHIDLNQ